MALEAHSPKMFHCDSQVRARKRTNSPSEKKEKTITKIQESELQVTGDSPKPCLQETDPETGKHSGELAVGSWMGEGR